MYGQVPEPAITLSISSYSDLPVISFGRRRILTIVSVMDKVTNHLIFCNNYIYEHVRSYKISQQHTSLYDFKDLGNAFHDVAFHSLHIYEL